MYLKYIYYLNIFSYIILNIFKIKEGKGININLLMFFLFIIWGVKIIKIEYFFK